MFEVIYRPHMIDILPGYIGAVFCWELREASEDGVIFFARRHIQAIILPKIRTTGLVK